MKHIVVLLFMYLPYYIYSNTITNDTCSNKVPIVYTDCISINVESKKECCMVTEQKDKETTNKYCKSYNATEINNFTKTSIKGFTYNCKTTNSTNTSPSPTPNPSPASPSTTPPTNPNIKSGNLSQDKQYFIFNNYYSFKNFCEGTVPRRKGDCNYMKYADYWCCRVRYLGSDLTSYCMQYKDDLAKQLIKTSSSYYSYDCHGEFVKTLIAFFLILFALLLF